MRAIIFSSRSFRKVTTASKLCSCSERASASSNVVASKRDAVQSHLKSNGIPSFVYYPVPLHLLPIYKNDTVSYRVGKMDNPLVAANEVLSLPMHTELTEEQLSFIAAAVRSFF